MNLARPVIALDPRRFGRGRIRSIAIAQSGVTLSDDVRLFLTTFAGGFLFVSLLIA